MTRKGEAVMAMTMMAVGVLVFVLTVEMDPYIASAINSTCLKSSFIMAGTTTTTTTTTISKKTSQMLLPSSAYCFFFSETLWTNILDI